MDYFDFIKLAKEYDFYYPQQLYIAALHMDIPDQAIDRFLASCCEDETLLWDNVISFTYNGRTVYVMDEPTSELVVDKYQNMERTTAQLEIPDKYHEYFRFDDYCNHAFSSLHDVFDVVEEFELDLDNVIIPKYYVAEC